MRTKEDILAKELTNYINNKHTQDECIGFSDGFEVGIKYADEQSVAFNKWINKNYYLFVNDGYMSKGRFNKFQEDTKVYTTTELLTIFKEQNGK